MQTRHTISILESHYWPSIAYISVCNIANEVQIEIHENYQKQSYRNRCRLISAQKPINLTVPVSKPTGKQPTGTLKIDNSQNWQKNHLRTLQTCYGKSIYFEHYFPQILPFYSKKYTYLIDLNHDILTFCLKFCANAPLVSDTLSYQIYPPEILDMRRVFEPHKLPDFYIPVLYGQVFELPTEPNMSFLDLLFCKGPFAMDIAAQSLDEAKIISGNYLS